MFILHRNRVKRYKKSDPVRLRLHWCINRPGVQTHRVPTAIHCQAFPLFTVGIVMRGWITQTQKREHPPNLIPVENGPLLQNKAQYRLGSEIKLKGSNLMISYLIGLNNLKTSTYRAMQATSRKFRHLIVDLSKSFVQTFLNQGIEGLLFNVFL